MPAEPAPAATARKIPPVTDPAADVSELLSLIIGETGALEGSGGVLRIAVYHATSFPWDEVFKALLYREYQVRVTKWKADLFVEATPGA